MFLIIAAWIYYFLLILSIGAGTLKLIQKFAGASLDLRFGTFYQFWFGFAVLVGLLQIISLFLPIGNVAFIISTLVAIVFALLNYRSLAGKLALLSNSLSTTRGILSLVAVCFLLMLVSYSANREVLHADTFIYHFNGVKWAREYPAVPGLANIHSRLGFNSSFFLFAALTETGFYSGESTHIALSLMMAVCLIHWFFIISNPKELMSKRIFCMMTTLFLFNHIISQIDITSLSTDYPMSVLTLVFCLVLLDKLEHKILLLLPLAAVIFTFKLSGMLVIAAGLVILSGYILQLLYRNKNRAFRKLEVRILSTSFVLLCFIASGFIIRNIIVSGWLIYPFPVGNMHLPWSIPEPYVLNMIDWIKSYPKIPGGASPKTIKANDFYFWFYQWFNQFRVSGEFNIFCWSLFILCWSAFQVSSFAKFIYAHLNMALLILFSLGSILFWFISAPELRFGSIYFYLLLASSIVFLYQGSRYKSQLKIFIYVIFIYQIIDRIPAIPIGERNLFTFTYTKPRKLKRVIDSPPDEKPPLYIYMPLGVGACGNSPIPCTPYAGGYIDNHRLIRQRVPGDLSKGFLPTK